MRVFGWVASLAMLALTGCEPQSSDVYVDKSWVRLSAVPGEPAAAYFRLTGGAKDEALFHVSSELVVKTELHESMAGMPNMDGMAMTSMKPLDSVAVPARAKVVFAPGGKHVMLFDVNPSVKRGSSLPLIFVFKSGLQLQDSATVVAAGDPDPTK